ncbi:MAG: hypothetical protein COX43_04225 [Parcubacteria group bacterium CG23_combo_of_CG06-09_8_20_14_all_35_9]|nr:MAG: hypothetical protein COX43_04225 [Parcubacteria group bacterium CG23_combo_of_CG06-09_8_20_14_all_35_9]
MPKEKEIPAEGSGGRAMETNRAAIVEWKEKLEKASERGDYAAVRKAQEAIEKLKEDKSKILEGGM